MNSINNESIKEQSSTDEILNESINNEPINELRFADERYKDLNKEQSDELYELSQKQIEPTQLLTDTETFIFIDE